MHWSSFLVGAVVGWLVEFLLGRQRRMAEESLLLAKMRGVQEDLEGCRARAMEQGLEIERLNAALAARASAGSPEVGADASVTRAPEMAIELTPPEAQPVEPDDLALLEGIGPKVNELLNEGGVSTFAQLAATDVERLRSILSSGGSRFRVIDPRSWPEQALLARDGKWDELKAFQGTLKGGRAV